MGLDAYMPESRATTRYEEIPGVLYEYRVRANVGGLATGWSTVVTESSIDESDIVSEGIQQLLIDPVTDAYSVVHNYTAIQKIIGKVRIRLGRTGAGDFDPIKASELQLDLYDSGGYFKRTDVRRAKVWWRMCKNGRVFDEFRGYIWTRKVIGDFDRDKQLVQILCYDAFQRFQEEEIFIGEGEGIFDIPVTIFQPNSITGFINHALDTIGWDESLRDIQETRTTTTTPLLDKEDDGDARALLRDAADAIIGSIFQAKNGKVKLVSRDIYNNGVVVVVLVS